MDEEVFAFGSFRLIPAQRMLSEDGKPLRLGGRALDILVALVERPGETISKEERIAQAWPDTVVEEAALTRENTLSATAAPDGADMAGSLPALLTQVVGRDEIILALTTQLARRRVMTIVGAGGIGKTTVALAVADRARASYEDGVWFVELASLSDPDLVPSAVGAALGVHPSGGDHTRALGAWLRDKAALLVLDSCEHVVGAAASLAEM